MATTCRFRCVMIVMCDDPAVSVGCAIGRGEAFPVGARVSVEVDKVSVSSRRIEGSAQLIVQRAA